MRGSCQVAMATSVLQALHPLPGRCSRLPGETEMPSDCFDSILQLQGLNIFGSLSPAQCGGGWFMDSSMLAPFPHA